MFGTIIKKKLSSDQFANIFINVIFSSTEEGFKYISEMINADPAFVTCPNIMENEVTYFQMIILAYNLEVLDNYFEPNQIADVKTEIFGRLSKIFNIEGVKVKEAIKHYSDYIKRVNHPSKKLFYGLSKAIFFKYKLSEYQEEYFKRLQAPNPLFLKRLDNITSNFVWDWDNFLKKYRI